MLAFHSEIFISCFKTPETALFASFAHLRNASAGQAKGNADLREEADHFAHVVRDDIMVPASNSGNPSIPGATKIW
jgi:hypothetical protein